jgi:hypothetical protein
MLFTASTVSKMEAELTGLAKLGLAGTLHKVFADWAAMRSGNAGVRTIDAILLRARNDAAAAGVNCSCGARSLLGLP